MGKRLPIILYGATGYTGQLIAAELNRRKLSFAISGRSRNKLEALSDSLSSAPEVIVADVNDASSLQGMAARAKVVLSAAGPFQKLGPPVQEACLRAGSHFVDITGESSYMLQAFALNHRVKEAGLTFVNAAGFDVVPTDITAWLATHKLGDVEQVDIGLSFNNMGTSKGTQRSMLGMLTETSVGYEGGEWRPTPLGSFTRGLNFPEPFGRQFGVYVPIGDIVTGPRTTGGHTVRTFIAAPSKRAARVVAPLLKASALLPLQKLESSRIFQHIGKRLVGDSNGGPSSSERKNTEFAVFVEARGGDGRHTAWMLGRDPYGMTATSSVEMARLLAEEVSKVRGVLSPVQAMGDVQAFLEHLKPHDLTWGSTDA